MYSLFVGDKYTCRRTCGRGTVRKGRELVGGGFMEGGIYIPASYRVAYSRRSLDPHTSVDRRIANSRSGIRSGAGVCVRST